MRGHNSSAIIDVTNNTALYSFSPQRGDFTLQWEVDTGAVEWPAVPNDVHCSDEEFAGLVVDLRRWAADVARAFSYVTDAACARTETLTFSGNAIKFSLAFPTTTVKGRLTGQQARIEARPTNVLTWSEFMALIDFLERIETFAPSL